MEEPLRVLIVERRHADLCIAGHLLTDYDLDFSWQCVASPLTVPVRVFPPSRIAVGESLAQ
jgi:hypothetical protein